MTPQEMAQHLLEVLRQMTPDERAEFLKLVGLSEDVMSAQGE